MKNKLLLAVLCFTTTVFAKNNDAFNSIEKCKSKLAQVSASVKLNRKGHWPAPVRAAMLHANRLKSNGVNDLESWKSAISLLPADKQ